MGKLERYIIVSVVTAIIFFLIWYFSDIVLYVVLAFVLSLVGKPLMDVICNLKYKNITCPRWLSATLVVFIFIGIFVVSVQQLIPLIYDKIAVYTNSHLGDIRSVIEVPMQKFNNLISGYFGKEYELESKDIINNLTHRFSGIVSGIYTNVGSIFDFVASLVVASFSVFFITFFFLKEDGLFKSGLTMLFPARYETKIVSALDSSITLLSKYFLALLMESTIKLVIITGGFMIFGVDFATSLIIGIISAVLNVIPYIGPLIGAVVGIFIAIAAYHGGIEGLILFSVILFSVFQLIDNVIIQPYIYSTSVKAHPLEIFLIILVAGSFAGVLGMLLAIPVYTILRVFSKAFFNNLRVVRKLTENINE